MPRELPGNFRRRIHALNRPVNFSGNSSRRRIWLVRSLSQLPSLPNYRPRMASGWQWRRRGLSVQRLSIVWDGIPPENGGLGVDQFSVTPVVAAVVDEFLGSDESSKSPQSSSTCNHNLPRGDLLDSRFSINVVWKRAMLSVRGVYVLSSLHLSAGGSQRVLEFFSLRRLCRYPGAAGEL